ncbi:MAG: ATP-binding protein, partial [Myxococcota bacterium]
FLFNTTIVMAFVLVILYEPMKVLVEERINRLLFRERFEFAHQLALLRREIANVVELDELTTLVMQRLGNSLRVTQASLFLLENDALGYRCVGAIGEAPERLDAATERMFLERLRERRFLVRRDLEDDLDEARKSTHIDEDDIDRLEEVIRMVKELRAAVVIAIVSNDRLVGLLNVNDERLRDPYAPEEIRSLVQIAAQAAISIENSQAVASLREKDRLAAIGEMAAGLAHEIRNPLGAIKGAVQFLSISDALAHDTTESDEEDDESPEAFLDIIIEETNRLNKVVSQFLDYARPYRGDPEQCDISRLVERIEPLFRPQAEAWGVEVELHLATSLPEASADPEQIKQVILNLALNAIQATGAAPLEPEDVPRADEPIEQRRGSGPRPPRLTFTTGLTRRVHNSGGRLLARDMVEIALIDNGKGIPAEDQDNIFIPFFTTKQKGTGLGLAISQRIIENLGGRIELSSSVGQGTTFRVLLPLWDASSRSLSDLPTVTGPSRALPNTSTPQPLANERA